MTGLAHKLTQQGLRVLGIGCAVALAPVSGLAGGSGSTAPVVLELYTSQGCISCPPADALFSRLAAEPGVIALALHVDYWDYLGWTDDFADPTHTERQKRYAQAAGAKMIYTPQLIIGGTSRLQGAREDEIRARIAEQAAHPARVDLRVTRQGERVLIEAEANPPLDHPTTLSLVRYLPRQEVAIERGENAGQSITYHNIVNSWSTVAEWGGQAPLSLNLAAPGDAPLVVIVQEQGPGPVLAAHLID